MRIAICGAGLVGSYLYRLLSQAEFGPVTIFEKPVPPKTRCGINSCAWGTSIGFEKLVRDAFLDPANYTLRTFDSMVVNGMKVKAKSRIVDKPKLIADLRKGAKILNTPLPENEFERIIDATGTVRSFLPPINKDIISSNVQYRVASQEIHDLSIEISNLGYAWLFPMSGNEYHIGAGSIRMSPRHMLERLGWLKNSSQICACTGKIRLSSPYFSLPFVNTPNNGHCQIWGVGEAIGCVAPIVGEGIIPGLKSASLLLDNWEDPEAYEKAILKEFSWMKGERKIVDKAAQGKRMGVFDARIFVNSTKRFEMNINCNQGLSLLRSISKTS